MARSNGLRLSLERRLRLESVKEDDTKKGHGPPEYLKPDDTLCADTLSGGENLLSTS